MRVVPAIDIIKGKLVRLSEGDYGSVSSYGLSPLDAAKMFEDGGLTSLHLVDLDGAAGRGSNLDVLERIASETRLEVDFGGGIRTEEDCRRAFDAGASAVNVGSVAVKDPESILDWNEKFNNRIILSADARDGRIAVSGWMEDTDISVIPFIQRFLDNGIRRATVTDIARDGMLSGPSLGLYKTILDALPDLCLIASGGISRLSDLVSLSRIGVKAAIVGKAFYEGRMTIAEMKEAECLQDA